MRRLKEEKKSHQSETQNLDSSVSAMLALGI